MGIPDMNIEQGSTGQRRQDSCRNSEHVRDTHVFKDLSVDYGLASGVQGPRSHPMMVGLS
ncbi:hypothetical protein SY94_6033 (plasmid) [Agrobacterium tumefaciens]|uniref:Uncharacterized protein n=2 Tax=Agrobacterium tumefaciens TaxID=358 RepID=A0A2Z2PUT1_AGRTU|nr:hypothetical protein [Agrobacterium tumefaciens]KJX85345.1 hypothetical protein SY94_6033 [Agrobacterium tumefaciens]